MTPTQLRAFAAVVRLGSVKEAAAELAVTEAAVSGHVALLRKELDDQLFTRTGAGLAFTPGGLRLASRAIEMLGLQDQTKREVSAAGQGRRLLRLATSSLFAEHAAPGLIQLFTSRAKDLDVELSVRPTAHLAGLLTTRAIDVAIGPAEALSPEALPVTPFLKYQVAVVVGDAHRLAAGRAHPDALRDELWLLGPSAAASDGVTRRLLRTLGVPEDRQRIFQSHAAALEEVMRGTGVGVAVTFSVAADLAEGRLVQVDARGTRAEGMWAAMTLPADSVTGAAAELVRFITTPRATQAMLHGAGATIGHFRPSVHVTLWS
ncbi:MAG: LysR family transcriptional regulator [Acidimicrobiales bacterium]